MQLIVNQQPFDFAADAIDVPTLLQDRGVKEHAVAVAVNGEVVPRRKWETVRLADGDRVELVKVVAGGTWEDDPLVIAGETFQSRLLMGTGRFVSPDVLRASLEASGTELITVAIQMTGVDGSGSDAGILASYDRARYRLLPNTAGALSVRQAVFMAELAREALETNWVKLEVIGDERTLWPDVAGTVEATQILVREGFVVLPYTTTDLVTALRLEEYGAATVMPLGSMIGSGQGVQDWEGVRRIAERVQVPVVVDAGIGTPSDAVRAIEAGAAACLINTAVSRSDDPPTMAAAMRQAVVAGRLGYRAGRMPRSEVAIPSSPIEGLVGAGRSRGSGGGRVASDGADIVVVGGGVIGTAIAYFAATAGARVTLIERSRLAAGASGVAAGMLAPQVEAPFADPFFELALLGRAEHKPTAARLLDEVGLDVEYRQTGILRVARTEAERADLMRQHRWQSAAGLAAEWLEPAELGTLEPLLRGVAGRLLAGGLWLAEEGQVRSPRLVQALAMGAARAGARLLEGTPATGLETSGDRVTGVRTPSGVVRGETVVLAAGVWSPELGRTVGLELPVTPVKGQVLSLRGIDRTPRQVLWSGECYLVPRPDGEIVLGATEEEGNFDARPTLAGLNRLTEAALEVVPAVGGLVVEGIWAGLRPAAPDRHPIVGWAPGLERLMVATAHFRNGVLLGPLTGKRVAAHILEGESLGEFEPFGAARFAARD